MDSLSIVKEKNITEFLNLKDNELLNYYRQAPKKLQKVLKNVYLACYRFNLLDTQTLYMLEQIIRPYKNDLLDKMFEENKKEEDTLIKMR